MKKILFLLLITIFYNLSFSYEDYYQKVYTIKISISELFNLLNVTDKQKDNLYYIFNTSQDKAKKIEKKFISFEEKKFELNKIEKERYENIKNILTNSQLLTFNEYINKQKDNFEKKNNNIKSLIDNLNLSNTQKASILRLEKAFKRNLNNLNAKNLSPKDFYNQFNILKETRNSQIDKILTDEQKNILNSFRK